MESNKANGKKHDGIFTSPEIVSYMLDLADYTPNRDLSTTVVIEPSCGEGEFVVEIISRLAQSALKYRFDPSEAINRCLTCYETDPERLYACIRRIHARFPHITLGENVCRNEDFLTANVPHADLVVGNPPYVRHEQIPEPQKALYRQLFPTFRHRADLYVPFFEKSLHCLRPEGKHCFICSNRWLKNQYGHGLRHLIASSFRLCAIVNLEKANPFQVKVSAYPAISLIANSPARKSFLYAETDRLPNIPQTEATAQQRATPRNGDWDDVFNTVPNSNGLTTIENLGFKIGIGVATGADKVFIGQHLPSFVEKELLLPVLTAKDIRNNCLNWSGNYLFNPFNECGKVIDLSLFPKAKNYLEAHKEKLQSRHVSRTNPANWYRTIDKIHKELLAQPKILLPDMSANSLILIDTGHFYPHHNLYYITGHSVESLKVLSAILMSDFVTGQLVQLTNCMNGGYPRWQSQYIRKLKVPDIYAIKPYDSQKLTSLYDTQNLPGINALVNHIVA